MRSRNRYIIIGHVSLDEVEVRVNIAMKYGYKPTGGIFNCGRQLEWCQSMVLPLWRKYL